MHSLTYWSILKIAIFGHEIWPLPKVPEVGTYTLFLTRGLKLSSAFLLYGQCFPRYRPISKIAIFAMKLGHLAKAPHTLSFYPYGVEIELIFALWAAVSEIWADLLEE